MHGIRLQKPIHIPHVPQDRTSGSCQIYLKSPKYILIKSGNRHNILQDNQQSPASNIIIRAV